MHERHGGCGGGSEGRPRLRASIVRRRRGRLAVSFDDEPVLTSDHERAAEMFNVCRADAGVQGPVVDFLVCAVAQRLDAPLLTAHRDFGRFPSLPPVRVHGKS